MGALSQVMNFNFPVHSKGWQTYQSHSIQNDITSHISSHLIFCQLKATDSLWKENWSDKHAFHSKGTDHKCMQEKRKKKLNKNNSCLDVLFFSNCLLIWEKNVLEIPWCICFRLLLWPYILYSNIKGLTSLETIPLFSASINFQVNTNL